MGLISLLLLPLLCAQDSLGDPLPTGAVARLGTSRLIHGGVVTATAFSPDGKLFASGGCDGKLRLWEVPSGKPVRVLHLGATVYKPWISIALSRDGRTIAARGEDAVRLWSIPSGELLRTLSAPGDGDAALVFSPDGKELGCLLPGSVLVRWDVDTGKEVEPSPPLLPDGESGGSCLVYSPDGRTFAVGVGKVARAFERRGGGERTLFKGHTGLITSVDFSPDGDLFLTGSQDGSLRLWEAATGEELLSIPAYKSGMIRAAFAPGGRRLVSAQAPEVAPIALFKPEEFGTDREIHLWEVSTGKKVDTIRQPDPGFVAFSVSPDGTLLAAAGRQSIHFWDLSTGKEIPRGAGHRTRVNAIAFSPDGRTLATAADHDPVIRLWDRPSGREIGQLKGTRPYEGVHHLVFFPDGKTLAQANPPVQLWDLSTAEELHWRSGNDRKDYLSGRAFAFSPDGKTLASAGPGGTIQLRDVVSGKRLATLKSESGTITSIAISRDGQCLAAGAADKSVHLWEASNGKLRWSGFMGSGLLPNGAPVERSTFVSFLPDDRSLAGVQDGRMKVWDLATGRVLEEPEGEWSNGFALLLSPDGKAMAGWRKDGVVLWETATGTEVWIQEWNDVGYRHRSDALREAGAGLFAFSPDGRTFASAPDGVVLLWSLGVRRAPPQALSSDDVGRQWVLLGRDGRAARSALQALAGGGKSIVEDFDRQLAQPAPLGAGRLESLVMDLGSDDIPTRERATQELEEQGSESGVLPRLEGDLPAETRARLEKVLATWSRPIAASGEGLRLSRAIQALELDGSREARELLDRIGRTARLNRGRLDARSALLRLSLATPEK